MRNENGFGTIVKLPGTRRKPYGVRITTGWKDGKQQRKYLGYYPTRQDALIALAEYHKGAYSVELAKLSLREMYDRWIKRIEPNVSKSVLTVHNMAYTRFGKLGDVEFTKIKADQLQDWMDGIEMKPSSKRNIKSTMMQLWRYGIKNDIVQLNYAEHIEIREKSEVVGKTFTDEEIKVLWENTDNKTARWTLILIYTGMRIGELLDMKRETMFLDEGYMIGGSKTEAGRDRVIPLHDKILPLVKQELGDSEYLLNKNGKQYTYPMAKLQFKALMDKYAWVHKPHDTRKTAVSIMHSANIPMETIRIIVGHSGKGVTETHYLRKSPQELVEAVNMIEIL